MGKPLKSLSALLTLLLALPLTAAAPRVRVQTPIYEEKEFFSSVSKAGSYEVAGEVIAGVVPHHLLAGDMIASFLKTASEADYETVVLVAPSHFSAGERVYTSRLSWTTPFGEFKNDRGVTEKLLLSRGIGAAVNDTLVGNDHSVAGLVPYIKYYLPKAEISILLVENRTTIKTAEAISQKLLELSRQKKLLALFSVDFSHYLSPGEAAKEDKLSIDTIKKGDYRKLLSFTDRNFDSPASIITFLKYLEIRGVNETSFLDHRSSPDYINRPMTDNAFGMGITTYFVLAGSLIPQ